MPLYAVPSSRYTYTLPSGFVADTIDYRVQTPAVVGTPTHAKVRIDAFSRDGSKIEGLTALEVSITVPHATLGTDLAYTTGMVPPAGVTAGYRTKVWTLTHLDRLNHVILGFHWTPLQTGPITVAYTFKAVETTQPSRPMLVLRLPVTVVAGSTSS